MPDTNAGLAASTSSGTSENIPTGCTERLVRSLSTAQKSGQLMMVGAQGGLAASSLDTLLRDSKVGGLVLLGPWSDSAVVTASVNRWQQRGRDASQGIGLLLAADQEGGTVQRLTGRGFSDTPAALTQGSTPGMVAATSSQVGKELKAAGVNVDLAPVADTVSAEFSRQNGPIGALQREYGNDPEAVSTAVSLAVKGLQTAGVSATLKHFPGLGRVTGNTDFTSGGTTDTTMTSDDPYLTPFVAGIAAGADLVMVSSALYPKIDPGHRAMFSRTVVTDVLRGKLNYAGVVITDDVGVAKAASGLAVSDRATQFIAAGGDIVLTGVPSQVPIMIKAIMGRAAADPAFAAQVDAAVVRVIDLKVRRGLAAC